MMYLVVLLVCVNQVIGQIMMPGYCDPNIKYMAVNPGVTFLGKWYLLKNMGYSNAVGKCPAVVIRSLSNEESATWLVDRQFIENKEAIVYTGPEFLTFTGGFSSNWLRFTSEPSQRANYHVIDTDYTTFFVLYVCLQTSPSSKTVATQLYTKKGKMPVEGVRRLEHLIHRYPELKSQWTTFDHSHCSKHFENSSKISME